MKGLDVQNSEITDPQVVFFKNTYHYYKVKTSDIVLLKGSGSYCQVICQDMEHTISKNLGYVHEKINGSRGFIRVHRSYVINKKFVLKFTDGKVWVRDYQVAIGPTYKDKFKEEFVLI